jgi:hypothetical protein
MSQAPLPPSDRLRALAQEAASRLRGASSPARAPQRAQAASVTRDELAPLRTLPLAELRSLAQRQIEGARKALQDASKWDWWAPAAALPVHLGRWTPHRDAIDHAQELVRRADEDPDETTRRRQYIAAYAEARGQVELVTKEAQLGSTGYLVTYVGTLAGDEAVRNVQRTVQNLKDTGQKLRDGAGDLLSLGLKVGAVLGALYLASKVIK